MSAVGPIDGIANGNHYEIRQLVRCVNGNDLRTVYASASERMARGFYDNYLRTYPAEYFELILVEHSEVCLDFTPKEPTP